MREDETLLEGIGEEPTVNTNTMEIIPALQTIIAGEYDWRWKSKDSWEWQAVHNEAHAGLLISSVDDDWPWLVIEKGNGDDTKAVKVTSCEYGVVLEVNAPEGTISRIYKHNYEEPLIITSESLMVDIRQVYDNEVFSSEQAVSICLEWLNESLIDAAFSLRPVREYR